MNIIVEQGIRYIIHSVVVEHTPYLKALRDTNVNKDMQEDSYVISNITLREISIYCRFIQEGEVKRANIETLLYISDFLGNKLPVNHGYPADYHIALIKDWWIDNVHHKLHSITYSDYSDKEPIRFLDKILGSDEYYIVGGYALELMSLVKYGNVISETNDIDVFLKNIDNIDKIISYCQDKSIPYKLYKHVINIRYQEYTDNGKTIQIILNKYEYMSDIISQFDLDSCCVILHNKTFYLNNRGKYASDNNINYFRPEKYSDRYSARLLKYSNRGFKVLIPNFTPLTNIDSICNDIEEEYDDNDRLIIYCSFNIGNTRGYTCSGYHYHDSDDEVLNIPVWQQDPFIRYSIPLENMEQFYLLTTLMLS